MGTGLTPSGKPNMSAIYDVCRNISAVKGDALILIESTVSVGTCRSVAESYGFDRLAHCPHRYWSGDTDRYGVVQSRVLGALNRKSLEDAWEFYSELGVPLHIAPSLEVAEVSKVVENAYRFVQIAFAEELKLLCEKHGVSFEHARRACNTKWNINILEARDGIGGECLPKDVRYLLSLGDAPLLHGAILADSDYKRAVVR